MTSSLPLRHKTQSRPAATWPLACEIAGAPERTRTSDARFRKPTLYPLSYGGLMASASKSTTTGRAITRANQREMRDLIPQKPAGRKLLSARSAKPLLRRNHSCPVGCPRDPIPPKWVSDRAFLALSQAKACIPARRPSHIHSFARPWRLRTPVRSPSRSSRTPVRRPSHPCAALRARPRAARRARSPLFAPLAQPAARLRALAHGARHPSHPSHPAHSRRNCPCHH